MEATTEARREQVQTAAARRMAAAAVLLCPPWRFGRRGLAVRAVEQAARRWAPRVESLVVACPAVAEPELRALGFSTAITPVSESGLSLLAGALRAASAERVLVLDKLSDAPESALWALEEALLEPDAAIAGLVDKEIGLREFPLLCAREVLPVVDALLGAGHTSLHDLMRRPFARYVTLD